MGFVSMETCDLSRVGKCRQVLDKLEHYSEGSTRLGPHEALIMEFGNIVRTVLQKFLHNAATSIMVPIEAAGGISCDILLRRPETLIESVDIRPSRGSACDRKTMVSADRGEKVVI